MTARTHRPNIILIYADDLGFGDVACYDHRCRIPTPHIDALATSGLRCTNAHAPDAICSPSRYGILTGRYSWRTERKQGNPKPGEQPWITPDRLSLPKLLQACGYNTAAMGKWGLGADWQSAAKPGRQGLDISAAAIDYSKAVHAGRCVGFDYDDVHLWYGADYFTKQYPCGAVNGAFEQVDGGRWYFENGISRGGDPQFAAFDMEEAQMHYIKRVTEYIDAQGGRTSQPDYGIDADKPFFVYYAPHIPHWPHVPAKRFQGSTEMGFYGDFVAELDWAVGEIVAALERNGMRENTLIFFTSDNGPERQTYDYIERHGHYSMGDWRGIKRDLWEGGHRTPFIASWPAALRSGAVSDRLISQTDIMATLADLLQYDMPDTAAEDSMSFLDELLPDRQVLHKRDFTIHHSANNKLALRQGNWVFIDDPTGDNDNQEPQWFRDQRGVVDHAETYELFDLAADPQQIQNLYADETERGQAMQQQLHRLRDAGRSAPDKRK